MKGIRLDELPKAFRDRNRKLIDDETKASCKERDPEPKIQPKLTPSEVAFYEELAKLNVGPPIKEYMFHKKRNWRFDYYFKPHKIAVEVEGGVHTGGRHVRGVGFMKDMEKYNEAACMGIFVLRAVPSELVRAAHLVQRTILRK